MSTHELSHSSPLAGLLREALPLHGIEFRHADRGLVQGRRLRSRAAWRLLARALERFGQWREQRRRQRQSWQTARLYWSLDDRLLRDLGMERDQVMSLMFDDPRKGS